MDYYLGFECGLCTENGIWFSSYIGNMLFFYDGVNTKYIGAFPGEEKEAYRLYSSVVKYKKMLIFTPLMAKNIAIYDIEKNEFLTIEIKKWLPKRTGQGKFCTSVLNGDYLYMFPEYYPGILKICLDNMKIVILDKWITELEKKFSLNNDIFFENDYSDCGEYLYFPFANTNAVLEFNKKSENIILHKVGEGKYSSIAKWHDVCILGGRNKKDLWYWEKKNDRCFTIQNILKEYSNTRFIASFIIEDTCWIFPEKGSDVLKIDLKKMLIDVDDKYSDEVMYRVNITNQTFSFVQMMENYFISFSMKTMTLFAHNIVTGKIEKRKLIIPNELQKEYILLWKNISFCITNKQMKNGGGKEEQSFSIVNLLEMVKYNRKMNKNDTKVEMCGKKIYDAIL